MNIALLCVLIIITGETDGFHVGNIGALSKEIGERISLRKLRSYDDPREDSKEPKTVTWNQILADALVNGIKVFSFYIGTDNGQEIGSSSNFLTNCISQMMHLYKTLIYDQIHRPIDTSFGTVMSKVDIKEHNDIDVDETGKDTPTNVDPKDEVANIEPKYHGKLCANCGGDKQSDVGIEIETRESVETTEKVQTSTACSPGLVASAGGCTDPKSKFILSIPYQCPIGYRRDWLGYCRPRL